MTPEPDGGQPTAPQSGRRGLTLLWTVVAVAVLWYIIDLTVRFPSMVMAIQDGLILAAALIAWRLTHWGSPLGRAAIALVIGAVVVGNVDRLLYIPFIIFGLFLVALALAPVAVAIITARLAPTQGWRQYSVMVATFAAVLSLPFLLLQWAVWRETALTEAGVGVESFEAAGPPFPSTTAPALNVARAYEPMYLFSAGEHWHPTSVVDYLRDADLKQADGHVVHPASIVAEADADRQKACRTAVGGCVITINCPSPDQDCARALSRTSVIYARVINNPLEAEHATARDRVQRGLTRLVQYWAFYRYDDWRGWWGGFRQWHEGDWELVTIGLGANGPLFVAFSAHCGGIWRPWSKVGGLSGRRTAGGRLVRVFGDNSHAHHVMAFIAEGSHGSYPDDGLRAPDWASCTDKVPKLFYVATFGPTLGGGVREHLDQVNAPSSEVFGPPVAIVDGRTSFMQFNGHWGDSNHFDLFGDDTVSAAPPTPLLQSSWREPLHTIFCNRFWRPKGSCPKFFDHD